MTIKQQFSVGVLLGLLVACAAPSIRQTILFPAKAEAMREVKTLAVVGIEGDRGGEFSARLEAFLAGIEVKGKPYFTVVDRVSLGRVLAEQEMGQSGLFSEDSVADLGKLSGADAIVSGHVALSVETFQGEKEVRKIEDGEEEHYYVKPTGCVKQVGHLAFTMKTTSVETSKLVFTKTYRASPQHTFCWSIGRQLTEGEIWEIAAGWILNELRQDIAPYLTVMTINLMKGERGEFQGNEAAKGLFERGLAYARSGDMGVACSAFRQVVTLHDQSPALHHNLGVCSEVDGNLADALAMYERAGSLSAWPVKNIRSALLRVKGRMLAEEKLAGQIRE